MHQQVEQRAHGVVVALVGGLGRGVVLRGIHGGPVDRVARVHGELPEERPLGAAVAVAERVQRVEVGVELGEVVDEGVAVAAAQVVGAGEPAEQLARVGFEVLGQAEQPAAAPDRDRAQLARPVVEVLEDLAVESPQVGEVVRARERAADHLADPRRR